MYHFFVYCTFPDNCYFFNIVHFLGYHDGHEIISVFKYYILPNNSVFCYATEFSRFRYLSVVYLFIYLLKLIYN